MREANGAPGCPGPPVRKTSTPRGAGPFWTATWSPSSPFTRPWWSSGTVRFEQVNPGDSAHRLRAREAGHARAGASREQGKHER